MKIDFSFLQRLKLKFDNFTKYKYEELKD